MLPEKVNKDLSDHGIDICKNEFKRRKRPTFSTMPKSTKHYIKDQILELTNKMPEAIKALAIASAMINVIVSCTLADKVIIDKLKMNGIYVKLNLSQEKEKKYKKFTSSEWPAKIQSFIISQPISRKVPGKSVSIRYGKREDKYLRNFTLIECYNMFKKQNPGFHYSFSMFSSVVPKNVKQATEKEVIPKCLYTTL